MFLIRFTLWYVVSQIILIQLYAYNLLVAFSQSFLPSCGIWSLKHRAEHLSSGWEDGEKEMRQVLGNSRPRSQ